MTRTKLSMLLLTGSLLALLSACEKGPYVELGGKKLTESDLKKEMPDRYKSMTDSLERQRASQVNSMLNELAHKRMIEDEAKEKGVSVQDYMASIQKNAAMPTPEEIDAFYEKLRKEGQLPPGGAAVKVDIQRYLAQQNREEAVQTEVSRLKKKYGFKLPVERFEVSAEGRPSRGNEKAKVTIVEFSDFECPFCIRAQATTKQLRAKYGDRVRWVFRNFPLDFHAKAMGAHLAAICVHQTKPDAFWAFFDGVFDPARDKKVLDPDSLRSRALGLGVDAGRFDACLQSPDTKKIVDTDIADGGKVGVTGTPAFFINGRMISGAQPANAFIEIIDEELSN